MEQTSTAAWLDAVAQALLAEGFHNTAWQLEPEGQVWGRVKDLDDGWQWHVRAFEDGRLEAEIEVGRWYLEHLSHPSQPAIKELADLLDKHGIPYVVVGTETQAISQPQAPQVLSDWVSLVIILGALGAIHLLTKLLEAESPNKVKS